MNGSRSTSFTMQRLPVFFVESCNCRCTMANGTGSNEIPPRVATGSYCHFQPAQSEPQRTEPPPKSKAEHKSDTVHLAKAGVVFLPQTTRQ